MEVKKIIKEIPDHEWQDIDVVKVEIQEARRKVRPIGYRETEWTWRYCKFEHETKAEWLKRMEVQKGNS